MPNIGFTELLIIAALAVLLFGSRLPGVGKALGTGIRNFKKGLAGCDDAGESKSSTPTAQARPQESSSEDFTSGQGTTPIKARVALSDAPHSLPHSLDGGASPSQSHSASGAKRETIVDADHDPHV